jgi:copper ion binding protein
VSSTIEQIVVTTPDMSCEHCVNAIQGDLSALDGVAQVRADLPTKQVTIAFDPGKVSVPQIEAALDDAGYPVAK